MASFSASAFFPIRVPGETALGQCLGTGLPVFSSDLSRDGAKSFFACGYEYFCKELYARPSWRHVYEVLQYDLPTKIYLDFDANRASCSEDEFDDSFNAFLNACVGALCEYFPDATEDPGDIPVMVLESSSDTKLSRHVVIQFTLESVLAVKDFVETVLETCPCESVDTSVYSRNRSFRLLYSTKKGKDTQLTLLNHPDPTAYNGDEVFSTLIQAIAPRHYLGPLKTAEIARTTHSFTKAPGSRVRSRGAAGLGTNSCRYLPDINPRIVVYLEQLGCTPKSARVSGDGVFMSVVVGGGICPFVRRCHRSNNSYFTLNTQTFVGWWRCADSECPDTCFDKSCFRWIIGD
jgi:hypothetical protein